MARLIWQNVDAPNFGNVTNALIAANSMFGDSMKNLQGVLARGKQEGKDAASSEVLARALQYTDNDAYNKALASGSLFDGINRGDVSADALGRLYGRSGELLQNQGTGIVNAGRGIANDISQYGLDRSKVTDGRADEQFTNRFGANRLLSEINADLNSGDSARAEAARKRLAEPGNADLLTRAGYDAPSIVSGSLGQTQAGYNFKQSEEAHRIFMKNTANAEAGRTKIMDVIGKSADADQAIRLLQRDDSVDPEVKKYGIDYINTIRDTNWAKPSPLERATGYNLTRPELPQSQGRSDGAAAVNAGRGSLFNNALTKTEGAGSFDTLFGHSQRDGGRFAGVKPSQMTISELAAFSKPNGEYGQWVKRELAKAGKKPVVATPMGAAQIVGSTLTSTAKKMGLSPDTVFTPNVQMAMANFLARGAVAGKSMPEAVKAIRGVWEGFKNLPDNQVAKIVNEIKGGGSVNLDGEIQTRDSQPIAGTPTAQAGTPTSNTLQAAASERATAPDYLNNIPAPTTGAGPTLAAAAAANQPTPSQAQIPAPVSGSSVNAPMAPAPTEAPMTSVLGDRMMGNAGTMATRLQDSMTLDRMYDQDRYLINEINQRPNSGKSNTELMKEIKTELDNVPMANIQDMFDKLTTDGGMGEGSKGVSPDIAAAIIRQSAGTRDLRSEFRKAGIEDPILGYPLAAIDGLIPTWDRYGFGFGDMRQGRIDENRMRQNLEKFQTKMGKQSTTTSAAPLERQRTSDSSVAGVEAIQTQIREIEQDLQRQIMDIRVSIKDPIRQRAAIDQITAQAEAMISDLTNRIVNTGARQQNLPYFDGAVR